MAGLAQSSILGLAVQEVLSLYQSDSALSIASEYGAIYEQHFQQVDRKGSGLVDVELAREHFSSLLQGEAFDAILAHVQRTVGPAEQLTKEQFLAVTHLVSCTLEAAQNSDALWVEPAPAPLPTHRKRHPTVLETLGGRVLAARDGLAGRGLPAFDEGEGQLITPQASEEEMVEGGIVELNAQAEVEHLRPQELVIQEREEEGSSKENMGSMANMQTVSQLQELSAVKGSSAAAGRSQQKAALSPSRRPGSVLSERGAGGTPASKKERTPKGIATSKESADISDFERKLKDLKRRMQQDQARLQGKPVDNVEHEEKVEEEEDSSALPSVVEDRVDAQAMPATVAVEARQSQSWESFNSSPGPQVADAEYASFPSTSPLAEGAAAAGSLFTDLSPTGTCLSNKGTARPSPSSEANPAQQQQGSQPGPGVIVAVGLPVGAPAAAVLATPAGDRDVAVAEGPALFATPETQHANRFAGAVDPAALAVAMQQLSIQQALKAQVAVAGSSSHRGSPFSDLQLDASDPATAAAVARAQAQLEAAAASLVAAATSRAAALPGGSAERHHSSGGSVGRCSSLDSEREPAAGRAAQLYTARDHHVGKLGRRLSEPSHVLGPLGAGEHRLQPHRGPSRLSQRNPQGPSPPSTSLPGSALSTARSVTSAALAEPLPFSRWNPMPREDLERCQAMFTTKGYAALGGMGQEDAQQLFARLQMAPHLFASVWDAADIDNDGVLNKQEFSLFMYVLRMVQRGYPVPPRLTPGQAAALLGLELLHGQPAAAAVGAAANPAAEQQGSIKVDLMRIKSALRPGRLQQHEAGTTPGQHSGQNGHSDSDDESGFEDNMSVYSHCTSASKMPGSQLQAYSHMLRPSSALSQRYGLTPDVGAVHSRLAINIRGAEIRYRKPLDKPFFSIAVHDSLLRTVELPQDTPPGDYRKETHLITLNHQIELSTHLAQMPRGSVVYFEIKHFKPQEGRMSTLCWTFLPLEKVVDFGPIINRVREGPLNLPLYKKPLDLSLRKLRRVGRGDDLRLTVAGLT